MSFLFGGGTGKYKAAIQQSQAASQAAIEQANRQAAQLQQNFMLQQSQFADRQAQMDQRYIDAINAATSEDERRRLQEEAAQASMESRRIAEENQLANLANSRVAQIVEGEGEERFSELATTGGDDLLQPKRKRKEQNLSSTLGINI